MNEIFCSRLKDLRISKGLGQIELAKKLGVSKGIISMWENGLREPKLTNLIALAKFFDESLDYITGLTD